MSTPDQEAIERLTRVRPAWVAMTTVADVLKDRNIPSARTLLHAGPPFPAWEVVPSPVRNSLALGVLFEGWAASIEEAFACLKNGEIGLAAAQDHDIVVPLAGVATPGMALHVVRDLNRDGAELLKYSVINEGMHHALRLGTLDHKLVGHHQWLNQELAHFFSTALKSPIELYPPMGQSIRAGDNGHSRTIAGSQLLAQTLLSRVVTPRSDRITKFLEQSAALALNPWMAAAALALDAGAGVEQSSLVTRIGGNGYEFGIQVSGLPGRWFTEIADPPRGPVEKQYQGQQATGAIGDSAVIDAFGLGGGAIDYAPESVPGLGDYLPRDARDRAGRLFPQILNDVGGIRTGLTAATVASENVSPIVLLGMIEQSGRSGRIGGGIYEPPPSLFAEAATAAR